MPDVDKLPVNDVPSPSCNVPSEIVVTPAYVLLAVSVNLPAPAFVTAKAEVPSLIIPEIELVPALVMLNVPVDLIAAAVNTSVVIVIPPSTNDPPPTAPVNVTSPVLDTPPLVIVNVLPVALPSTVELKRIVPLVAVNVGLTDNVTALE